MQANLNYKLLKIGAIASSDYNDQIFDNGQWRELNNNKHFKVDKYFKVRRPADAKSLEILLCIKEEIQRIELSTYYLKELIYK